MGRPILHVWGNASLIPHTTVTIHVPPGQAYGVAFGPTMTVTFSGGPPAVTRWLDFVSPFFREVVFEFDTVEDSPRVTTINTCAHANRPPSLACENLTFDRVYERAGVDVSQSSRRSTVPLSVAGGDSAWSDAELDAAMHKYWSTYSNSADWAVWTLFAGKHERSGLLGTMFDHSDQNQRQGCAIFNGALDDYIPSSYPQRPEHLARMRFFDVVHENGHCFNLHHAWLTYEFALNWPFFDDVSGAATFMNYPEKVFDFFGKFEYRFHDSELKFLRHAPDNFIEMGDAPFSGGQPYFEPDDATAPRPWKLEMSLHRARGVFEFLEPVTLTATLTNTSSHPQLIDEAVLEDGGNFALLIGRVGGRARFWRPFAQRCFLPTPRVLEPGQSLSASFFAATGLDGWYFAEPGAYVLQALLNTPDASVATRPVHLRVAHPCSWDEEVLAQQLFTRDVGRALSFGASPSQSGVSDTLRRARRLRRGPQALSACAVPGRRGRGVRRRRARNTGGALRRLVETKRRLRRAWCQDQGNVPPAAQESAVRKRVPSNSRGGRRPLRPPCTSTPTKEVSRTEVCDFADVDHVPLLGELVDGCEQLQRILWKVMSPLIGLTTQRKNKLFLSVGSQPVRDVRPTTYGTRLSVHLVEEDVRSKDARYQINIERKADRTRWGHAWASK